MSFVIPALPDTFVCSKLKKRCPENHLFIFSLEDTKRLAEKYKANRVVFGYHDEVVTSSESKQCPQKSNQHFLRVQPISETDSEACLKRNHVYTLEQTV